MKVEATLDYRIFYPKIKREERREGEGMGSRERRDKKEGKWLICKLCEFYHIFNFLGLKLKSYIC